MDLVEFFLPQKQLFAVEEPAVVNRRIWFCPEQLFYLATL